MLRKMFLIAVLALVVTAPLITEFSSVSASSHREAPLISQDPAADNTDLYAFVSPDRPDTVTIIANYIPLEEPAGGPNFNKFSDDVRYEINVDNDGDGHEDLTYRFRFTTTIRNDDTFLHNTSPRRTRTHRKPAGQDDPNAVLGIYASASRRKVSIMHDDDDQGEAPFMQVSRLGYPLINEVIIPLGKKDFWNRSDPADDAQFVPFYRSPELARVVNVLYGDKLAALGGAPARTTDRDDLVLILLTGVPLPGGHNLNFTGNAKADLLRLNLAIAPTHSVGQGDPLGVLNGDLAGFPNGRRLEDDVTDIELRAVADGYGSLLASLFGLPNHSPNNQIGDGVNQNDMPFLPHFPYVATPHQGYEHEHHMVGSTSTPHLN